MATAAAQLNSTGYLLFCGVCCSFVSRPVSARPSSSPLVLRRAGRQRTSVHAEAYTSTAVQHMYEDSVCMAISDRRAADL